MLIKRSLASMIVAVLSTAIVFGYFGGQGSSVPAPVNSVAASISGRVKTPNNRPIKGATIELKDANTNEVVKTTNSSSFGYYRIVGIETGRSYVLSVRHKTYLFAFPAQLIEVNEDRTGVDFIGEIID